MTVPPAARYKRHPGAVSADLGDELAVLDMQGGAYLGFNATAAHVWRLLDRPRGLDALCAAMTTEFAVDETRCRASVAALLERLAAAGLIVVENG